MSVSKNSRKYARVGFNAFVLPVSKLNSSSLMDGYEIVYVIAFGINGRNRNGNGKTLFRLTMTKLMPGATCGFYDYSCSLDEKRM